MNRLEFLRDRHRGQRAVLMANGPSLNVMDLGFLLREQVFGLNKIYLGIRRFRFYPRYYVAVNAKVIEQGAADIRALTCVKFIAARGAALVPEDALTYHVDTERPAARFCPDIAQGVHEGWTVTYAALQIAYYLGFEELVLIGLDHRFIHHGPANAPAVMSGPDPNHFSEHYFSPGQTWDNPDLSRSEESYRIAREIYKRDGRRILDATVDGACTVFEKVDYRHFFRVKP